MKTPHDCPHCICPPEPMENWIKAALIFTGNPADLIPTYELFRNYAGWWLTNVGQGRPMSQNSLTRRLRSQAMNIVTLGGKGNHLVGYRLTT
jgi:hypothetical protein